MNLDINDAVYLLVYAVTVVAILITYRNRIGHLEKALDRINRILYADSGALNLVSHDNCRNRLDMVYAAIRKGESGQQELLKKFDKLNENVLKIYFFLKLDQSQKADD
jgi:hypothetical protein